MTTPPALCAYSPKGSAGPDAWERPGVGPARLPQIASSVVFFTSSITA
jgi:hypothetical protein